MDATINFARQNGYVVTPFNRKITIFGIQDNNKHLASFAERAAINAPIQGGAADIIKLAMNKIAASLAETGLKTRMLLQVHDELVFEAPLDEVETAAALIKREMENITGIDLKVPLIADVGIGDNWGQGALKMPLAETTGQQQADTGETRRIKTPITATCRPATCRTGETKRIKIPLAETIGQRPDNRNKTHLKTLYC